jgi:mitosis inhibitor protein kinase SWE1
MHSNGVIHFDIKPANILISVVILEGSGLGGSAIMVGNGSSTGGKEKLEREGDRVYMPPEMLRGLFVMAADIFSYVWLHPLYISVLTAF